MARAIRKISKRVAVSFFWLGAFVTALFVKILVGNGDVNLSKLESEIKKVSSDTNVISPAKADAPPSSCSSCGCTGPGAGAY